MTTFDGRFVAYAPLPANRKSVDLIDPYAYTPDDPAKQRQAALNIVAWHGYPTSGTQAWEEMTEVLEMCGLREGLRCFRGMTCRTRRHVPVIPPPIGTALAFDPS